MRVERIGHWKHKGDRLEWRTFDGYADRNGIRLPVRSEVHVEDSSGQHDVLSELGSIDVGATVSATDFTIPEAYRSGFESWTLEERKKENSAEFAALARTGERCLDHRSPPE